MARKDEEAPMETQDQADLANDMQARIEEQQRIMEREEVERQARGFPAPMVADRGGSPSPQVDRLAFMEAQGMPTYLIQAEKRSMEANTAAWQEQLDLVKGMGAPQPVAPTVAAPDGGEMLSTAQQENDRILMSRMELVMENPPLRNGMTLEEQILTQPDETVPGGYYRVGNRIVDANGRILVEKP